MRALIVLATAFLFQNCVSVSSFQSARTVRPGEWSGFGGLSSQGVTYTENADSTESEIETYRVPLIEGGARWGISESTDIGLKYTTLSSLNGEFKWMMSDPSQQKTAHSIGIGITHSSFELGSGDGETKFTILDLTVPYFFTYDMSETSAFNVSPRYIMRNVATTSDSGDENESICFVGVNLGFNLSGFVIEVGAFSGVGDSDAVFNQVTIGYSGNNAVVNRGPVGSRKKRL